MKGNKRSGLSFALGHEQDGNVVLDNIFYKKSRFMYYANLIRRQYGHIYVRVSYAKGVYNDGVYETSVAAKKAFFAFIEESLVSYAMKIK